MALSDNKILTSERNAVYVKSNVGRRLTGTVEQNKNAFDKFPQLIMDKYNNLVDLLVGLGLDSIDTDLSSRYTKTETDTAIATETNNLIETITYVAGDGKFIITTKSGTTTIIDTNIEKIPASFELVEEEGKTYLKVTNDDGSTSKTDVSSLVNVYLFSDTDTIDFTESNGQVTATVKNNSITIDHLSLAAISTLEGYVSAAASSASVAEASATSAETSADNANAFMNSAEEYTNAANEAKTVTQTAATVASEQSIIAIQKATQAIQKAEEASASAALSESYAQGGTGTREGEDTNNAKYYMERASIVVSGFDYQGAWDSAKAYTTAQLVSYSYTLWVAKKSNVNSIPHEGSQDWDIFVGMPNVIDLGSFMTDDLFEHILDPNAHGNMNIDSNNAEITVQEDLYSHETAENAHGNIVIDGGDING